MSDVEINTTEQLLEGFREGRESAFSSIFRQLYPALCYYSLRFTNDQAAAEDIATDSFMKVWERRGNFYHLDALKSYLYTTVRHASFVWIKRQARQRSAEKDVGTRESQADRNI